MKKINPAAFKRSLAPFGQPLLMPKKYMYEKSTFNFMRPAKGLTLIEALVAMVIFAIGLLGMIKLLSISSRLQNNMEYQLQANLIANNIRETLNPSAGSLSPAFIEGVLDGSRCANNQLGCQQGKTVRAAINQQNQNLYGGADLTVLITHGNIANGALVTSIRCHDPIFAQIRFITKQLQTTANTAQQARSRVVTYNHQVGQYRLFNQNPNSWGVSCSN
jgi:type IV pilus modification protein PilV